MKNQQDDHHEVSLLQAEYTDRKQHGPDETSVKSTADMNQLDPERDAFQATQALGDSYTPNELTPSATPHFAVLNKTKENDIGLVVMGTIGRPGIDGFITGNTAERLLPHLSCSVLAVKPPDFVSPVSIQNRKGHHNEAI